MANIEFTCNFCKQTLEATDDMAGQEVDCPNCSKKILIPSLPSRPQQICPACQTPMEEGSVLCINCGFHLKLKKKIQTEFT